MPINRPFLQQKAELLVLVAAGCLSGVAGGIIAPIMPEIVEQFQINPRWAGIIVSIHCLTIALFSPLLGILADRIGKLKILIPSLILYAVAGSAGAFMTGFFPLLFTRALVGVGSGGIAAASIGILSNRYEGEQRARLLGYGASLIGISSIIFPLLGGWLGSSHWQFTFCLYGLGLPVAVGAVLTIREKPQRRSLTIGLSQNYKLSQSLQNSSNLTLFLSLALTSAIFYIVVIYAPLHFKAVIGAGTVLNGAILGSRALGAVIISALGASRLAKYLGIAQAISLGYLLMGGTLITIPFLEQVDLILLSSLIFGMGFGIIMPNLYNALAKLNLPEVRSSILAIGNGTSYLGQFLSPVFLGYLWQYGDVWVFYIGATVSIAIAFLTLRQNKAFHNC